MTARIFHLVPRQDDPHRAVRFLGEVLGTLSVWCECQIWEWPDAAWLEMVKRLASRVPAPWQDSEADTERAIHGALSAMVRLASHADDHTARLLLVEGLDGAVRTLGGASLSSLPANLGPQR